MTWKMALEMVLSHAHSLFTGDEPRCAVIGSAASALQGCEVSPRDIDLLAIQPGVVYRFAELMTAHTPPRCEHPPGHADWLSSVELPVSAGPDDYGFVWHFGRWLVESVKVEMAHIVAPEGFPTSEDGAGIWEAGPEIWPHLRRVSFACYQVRVVPLEIQLETSLQRGLEERLAAIQAVLQTEGADSGLLQRALSTTHLARFGAHPLGTGSQTEPG